MAFTTHYNIELADVGQDTSTWGQITNDAIDGLADEVFRIEGLTSEKFDTTGGTLTGALNGTSASFPGGVTGDLTGDVTGNLTGRADRADRLHTQRIFRLTGVVTSPPAAFDGTADVSIATTIADNAIPIAKINGLSNALAGKQATLAANQTRRIYVQASAPSNPVEGDIWFDTP